MFTKDFMKEILCGKKLLLKKADVRFVTVVKYDELSVKNLYDNFMTLDGVQQFFPSKYAKGR